MSAPERPPPPIVGKVTHQSIELYWEEALSTVQSANPKGSGRIRVTVQEEDSSGGWGNVYTGYAKTHIMEGLEQWTQYRYRIRFMNDHGNSEWSPSITVSTTKEPLNGEHLHKAILSQNCDELERILETGEVNTDIPNKYAFTPLMQAAQKGYIDMIEVLMNYGADVNFQNDAGKTALMLSSFAGNIHAVKELRYHKARYDLRDKGGSTALHWATDSGNTELIEWMLENGADVKATDHNGWTPLIRVGAVSGRREVAKLLLDYGSSVNHRDKDGKTVLMIAVVNGNQELVELLLEKNADLSVQNEYGKCAYEMAISMERRLVVRTLEDYMEKHGIKRHH